MSSGYQTYTNAMTSAPQIADGSLKGAHLAWMTGVSESLKGTQGNGDLYGNNSTENKVVIGGWKAIGGNVDVWFKISKADTWGIPLPVKISYAGPAHLSNGTQVWPDVSTNKLTVVTTESINGYMSYKG